MITAHSSPNIANGLVGISYYSAICIGMVHTMLQLSTVKIAMTYEICNWIIWHFIWKFELNMLANEFVYLSTVKVKNVYLCFFDEADPFEASSCLLSSTLFWNFCYIWTLHFQFNFFLGFFLTVVVAARFDPTNFPSF